MTPDAAARAANRIPLYRPPLFSRRAWPVIRRNLLVWRKLAAASLAFNVAEPLLTLVAFGYGLGALIGSVQGLPYITFLASGSIVMSGALAATFEALYSAFSRMHQQKTWDSILNAPVSLDDIVLGEMLWAALKSMFSVLAILAVIAALGISRAPTMLAAVPVLAFVGVVFASIALTINAVARSFDFFSYYLTLVVTPMTFLSGVYFPLEQLPGWLQAVAQALPLTAAVELVRPLVVGGWPEQWLRPLAILSAYAAGGYYIAMVLTRRRFFR